MTKKYSSFDEIDQDLKVLKLEREIYNESVKLELARAKVNLHPLRLARTLKLTMQKWGFGIMLNVLNSGFLNPKAKK